MKQIESERREGTRKISGHNSFSVDASFTKSREEIATEKIDLNTKSTTRTIRSGKGLNLKKY